LGEKRTQTEARSGFAGFLVKMRGHEVIRRGGNIAGLDREARKLPRRGGNRSAHQLLPLSGPALTGAESSHDPTLSRLMPRYSVALTPCRDSLVPLEGTHISGFLVRPEGEGTKGFVNLLKDLHHLPFTYDEGLSELMKIFA
jgi:hypothetical protein